MLRVPWRFSRSWASAIVARTSTTPDMTAESEVNWAPISAGEEAGQAGLAGPGRAPQQQRREVAARDPAPERPALADEVLLPDELLEIARAHPRGKRLALGRWLEEGLGSCAGRPSGGWHGPDGSALRARAAGGRRPRGR